MFGKSVDTTIAAVAALTTTTACAMQPPVRGEAPSSAPEVMVVPPGVEVMVESVGYRVRGRSVEAITRSVDAGSPVWDGHHVYGLTQWHVGWYGATQARDDGCAVEDPKVFVQVRITLPAWEDALSPALPLDRAWTTFEDAVRRHEYGHRDVGIASGVEVLAALRDLSAADCARLERSARELVRGIEEAYRRRDEAYDTRTTVGRRQGAVWPPGDPGR